MSLDLVVLTAANAASLDQALAVYMDETAGMPDTSGELQAYAKEVNDAYSDGEWPFVADPVVDDCCVLLAVAQNSWEAEVPRLVERAHNRGLTALDPQRKELFPPGQRYVHVNEAGEGS